MLAKKATKMNTRIQRTETVRKNQRASIHPEPSAAIKEPSAAIGEPFGQCLFAEPDSWRDNLKLSRSKVTAPLVIARWLVSSPWSVNDT